MCHIAQPTKAIAAGEAEFRAIHIINLFLGMLKSSVTATFKKNFKTGRILYIKCTFIKMGSELNLGLIESTQKI